MNELKSELFLLNLNQKQTTKVIQLIKKLLSGNKTSIEYLLKNTTAKPDKIIEDVFGNSLRYFESIDSHFKRYNSVK